MLPVWFTRSLFYSGLAVFFISYAGRLKMIRRPAGFHFLATIFMVVDLIWLVAAIAIAAHGFIAVPTRLYRSAYSVWVPASAFICYASALNILVGGWATGTSERKD